MQRLALELRGVPCHTLELLTPDRKSIVASHSFGYRYKKAGVVLVNPVQASTVGGGLGRSRAFARMKMLDGVN